MTITRACALPLASGKVLVGFRDASYGWQGHAVVANMQAARHWLKREASARSVTLRPFWTYFQFWADVSAA